MLLVVGCEFSVKICRNVEESLVNLNKKSSQILRYVEIDSKNAISCFVANPR